jgi:hypothetical protein
VVRVETASHRGSSAEIFGGYVEAGLPGTTAYGGSFAGDHARVLVTTDGPAREFVLVLAETGVQLTAASVEAEGIDLDALRRAFPGF